MDIDSSYNGLQGLSSVQAGQLEKLSSSAEVAKPSDDSSALAISDNLTIQKSSLSQHIESMNSGIAMTTIAKNGIDSQTGVLENIRTQTLAAMEQGTGEEERVDIARQISDSIGQFNDIAESTRYNNQQLLKAKGTIEDDISIVADGTIFPLEKADTTSISNELNSFMGGFATDAEAREGFLTALDDGMDKLNIYADDYASAAVQMNSNAKNTLSSEAEQAASKLTVSKIDYAKESADFNKTNLQTQIGYLMQSQANAQQAKNIVLLS